MRSQLFRKAKVKSLRMTALIVAAFIVCWTPYYVLFVVFTFNDYDTIDHNMYMWIFFFGMANSMINPLIYGAFHVCKKRRRRFVNASSFYGVGIFAEPHNMESVVSECPILPMRKILMNTCCIFLTSKTPLTTFVHIQNNSLLNMFIVFA